MFFSSGVVKHGINYTGSDLEDTYICICTVKYLTKENNLHYKRFKEIN